MMKAQYLFLLLILATTVHALNETEVNDIVTALRPVIRNETQIAIENLSLQMNQNSAAVYNLTQRPFTTQLNDSQLATISANVTNGINVDQDEFSAEIIRTIEGRNAQTQSWLELNLLPRADEFEQTRRDKDNATGELQQLRIQYATASVSANATIAQMQAQIEQEKSQKNTMIATVSLVLALALLVNRSKVMALVRREPR